MNVERLPGHGAGGGQISRGEARFGQIEACQCPRLGPLQHIAVGASVVTRDTGGFEGCGLPVINPWDAA